MARADWPLWGYDDRVYFRGVPHDGMPGIYAMDMAGTPGATSEPQIIVRFDEPSIVSTSFDMTLVGNSLMFTVDEKESDIFLMDLEY